MFNDLKNYIRSLIFWRTNMYWNVWPRIVFIKIMHNFAAHCWDRASREQAECQRGIISSFSDAKNCKNNLKLYYLVYHMISFYRNQGRNLLCRNTKIKTKRIRNVQWQSIGVGSGAAGAALAAPIFWLVAVLGPRFLNTQVVCFTSSDTQGCSERNHPWVSEDVCFITQIQKIAYRVVHVSSKFQ